MEFDMEKRDFEFIESLIDPRLFYLSTDVIRLGMYDDAFLNNAHNAHNIKQLCKLNRFREAFVVSEEQNRSFRLIMSRLKGI